MMFTIHIPNILCCGYYFMVLSNTKFSIKCYYWLLKPVNYTVHILKEKVGLNSYLFARNIWLLQ